MHQYYLRRLLDTLLDTERHKALASVQAHPHLQALQAAAEAVQHQQDSDHTSSASSVSDSSDEASSSSEETAAPAHTGLAAAAASESAQSQGRQDAAQQLCHHNSMKQSADRGAAKDRQTAPNEQEMGHSLISDKKRKRSDCAEGVSAAPAGAKHQGNSQVTHQHVHLLQGHRTNELSVDVRRRPQCASVRQVDANGASSGVDSAAPAERPLQQQAANAGAEADCAEPRQPLHVVAMQLLANAVADCLNKPESTDDFAGKHDSCAYKKCKLVSCLDM